MGASVYLSTKAEGQYKCSVKASVCGGLTYVLTAAGFFDVTRIV